MFIILALSCTTSPMCMRRHNANVDCQLVVNAKVTPLLHHCFLLRSQAGQNSNLESILNAWMHYTERGRCMLQLNEQMSRLRERMAHLEGLLEGLREAISGKRVA